MKSKTLNFSIILLTLLSLTVTVKIASAKVYVAEPYLVQQPPYAGMTFYVYRASGMPEGWYMTFDGYLVAQTKGKIWVYGTMQGGEPVKTNYIVGSVNPAFTSITPYASGTNSGQAEGSQIIVQPRGAAPNQTAKQAYIPEWSLNPKFLAVSKWKSSVDRIGILHKQNIPLAWKGDYPNVIYAWMGDYWKQIDVNGERMPLVMDMNLYTFIKERKKGSRYRWYAEDVPILAEKTIGWGYLWMGEVFAKD